MDPFERSLREQLARREPSEGFTANVMDQIDQIRDLEGETQTVIELPKPSFLARWRWAAAGALAASMALTIAVRENSRRSQQAAAERAEAELAETLQLAGFKIHQARERVWGPLDDAAEKGEIK